MIRKHIYTCICDSFFLNMDKIIRTIVHTHGSNIICKFASQKLTFHSPLNVSTLNQTFLNNTGNKTYWKREAQVVGSTGGLKLQLLCRGL